MHKNDFLLSKAKHMRTHQTEAEKIVWAMLRNNGMGFKLKRQQPIGNYIIDFVSFDKKLIIEIDGGQHNKEVDQIRTEFLNREGFEILRFWNNDVLENREGVHQVIYGQLHHPFSPALSHGGRGG